MPETQSSHLTRCSSHPDQGVTVTVIVGALAIQLDKLEVLCVGLKALTMDHSDLMDTLRENESPDPSDPAAFGDPNHEGLVEFHLRHPTYRGYQVHLDWDAEAGAREASSEALNLAVLYRAMAAMQGMADVEYFHKVECD